MDFLPKIHILLIAFSSNFVYDNGYWILSQLSVK